MAPSAGEAKTVGISSRREEIGNWRREKLGDEFSVSKPSERSGIARVRGKPADQRDVKGQRLEGRP
jgi:hypothetical protein